MPSLNNFEKDFFNTILSITKKTFLPIIGFTFLMYAFTLAVLIPTVFMKLGIDLDFVSEYMSLGILERNDYITEHFLSKSIDGEHPFTKFANSIILAIIFIGLISSWFYNLLVLFLDKFIKTSEIDVLGSIKESFSSKILASFFMGILFIIILFVLEFLCLIPIMIFGSIHISLGVIVGIAVAVFFLAFLFRFTIALPHLLKTNASAIESLSYSFREIDFRTSLKYAGVLITAYVGIIIVSLLLMSLKALGTSGVIISSIIQLAFSGFIMSMGFTAMLGLYYLHSKSEPFKTEDVLELDDKFDHFR